MYGSDAGQPVPSLYTKGLSPLCDIYMLLNEHTKLTTVNIIVNNVGLVRKQYLAISETERCRAMKLGELIETYKINVHLRTCK